MSRVVVVVGLAVAALLGGAVAFGAIPGAGGQIDACVGKVGGVVRIIDVEKGEKCVAALERPLAWNQAGRPGPAGARGPQGESGPQGPAGSSAVAGKTCPAGQSLTGFDSSGELLCTGEEGGGGDADGDGIPDADDCAPNDPNPPGADGCFAPTTVYQLHNFAHGSGVVISDVLVTGVQANPGFVWVAVQPGSPSYLGPQNSGLEIGLVALPENPDLEVGDRITVLGILSHSQSVGTQLLALDVTVVGAGIPVPYELPPADFAAATDELDDVLVRVPGVSLTAHAGEDWLVSAGVTVVARLLAPLPSLPVGTDFASITGVAVIGHDIAGLQPRSAADIVVQ